MLRPAILTLWTVLLAAAFGLTMAARSQSAGADQVAWTIRIALMCYFSAAIWMLRISEDSWRKNSADVRIARLLWSLGWVAYAIHVTLAFRTYHHWSHVDAMVHTREVSGVGGGIFVSYLFTLVWCLDSLAWWLRPHAYVRRSRRLGWAIHGFIAFIVFNGAIVYASGPVRWISAVFFVILAWLMGLRLGRFRHAAVNSSKRVPA